MRPHVLQQLVYDQKRGIKKGIMSVCSIHHFVLEATIESAQEYSEVVLFEATANQVNQFGGYTGMKPEDFAVFVWQMADRLGFDKSRVILGGDHLGPLVWASFCEKEAMDNAEKLISQFVLAGFTKIHIDTSMRLADDDPEQRLTDKTIARRGALLCAKAEQTFKQYKEINPHACPPVYVIGSEVPAPGGKQEDPEKSQVTKAEDFIATVHAFRREYDKLGLQDAWERVVAVVVQPGVEFGDGEIDEYESGAFRELQTAMKVYPNLVFEGHSTDYQTPDKLRQMVEDGIAVLKVGPALTFALREALFSLEMIERELFVGTGVHLSNFKDVLDVEMLKNPANWEKHYQGNMNELLQKRRYSLSDRARYYLHVPEVELAIGRLIRNLSETTIPITLLSQYMPIQCAKVKRGIIAVKPRNLIKDRIINCIDEYAYGCGRGERSITH